MPRYRFTRVVQTGAGEIDAPDIETAKAILASSKAAVVPGKQFQYTLIEEVVAKSGDGYKETTTADLIGEQAAPAGFVVVTP